MASTNGCTYLKETLERLGRRTKRRNIGRDWISSVEQTKVGIELMYRDLLS